jgi:hypothetical protein
MGQPDKPRDHPTLKRKGSKGRYRSFPIVRHERDEYHVYMGFDTQKKAEQWIDDGIGAYLKKPDGMNKGAPKKLGKR